MGELQVAQVRIEEANHMRKQLNGEEYVSRASTAAIPSVDAIAKAGQTPKRTAAAIAAEVADKLAASSSSQMIMHSVLSTFAAEEAKSAGLANPTPSHSLSTIPTNSVNDSVSNSEKPLPISDPDVLVSAQPLVAPSNHSYQSVLLPRPTVQNQAPSSQAQFHMLPNPPSQQYLQPSGGIMTPYAYGSISPMPSGPRLPLPYMGSPMVPLVQQPSQITQPQPLSLSQQQAPLSQQQPIPLTQQPSSAPSFRPLQPPGMVYYGHPPHS